MPLVEARRLLEQRQQPLAPASLGLLTRIRLLVLERDAVAVGEPFDRLREVELLGLANEGDDVAALPAAEAIEELLGRVDGEARSLLVVEGAEARVARAGTAELRPRRNDLDHVGRFDGLANRCFLDPGHYPSDSAYERAKRSVIPAT